MREILCESTFFGVTVSILAYEAGIFLKKKLKLAIFNPLLVAVAAADLAAEASRQGHSGRAGFRRAYKPDLDSGDGRGFRTEP